MPGAQTDGAAGSTETSEMPSGTAMTGEEMPGTETEEPGAGDGAQMQPDTMEPGAAMSGEEMLQRSMGLTAEEEPAGFVAGPRAIVPPAEFEARGLAPLVESPPSLQYHGGPVLQSVEVVPIYWGAAWASGTNAQLTNQLDGFFDFIVTSEYMDLLNEYSTASTPIQHGSRLASERISNSEPGTIVGGVRQVTDAQIQSALQGWITNHTVPATTANTLYFIFLPPDVVSILG